MDSGVRTHESRVKSVWLSGFILGQKSSTLYRLCGPTSAEMLRSAAVHAAVGFAQPPSSS